MDTPRVIIFPQTVLALEGFLLALVIIGCACWDFPLLAGTLWGDPSTRLYTRGVQGPVLGGGGRDQSMN